MSHEGLITKLGKAVDEYLAERRQDKVVPCTAVGNRLNRHRFGMLLPTPGNVLFSVVLIIGLLWAQSAGALPLATPSAASTGTIAYQGRLADTAGAPLTGTYNMTFRLYSAASGGAPLWEETWTGANSVQVSDGLFNVMLGSLTAIPQNLVTTNSSLFLGISVGTDSEMAPRVQLGSVPFAVQALTVPDGSITKAKLAGDINLTPADGSITTAKLSDKAVVPAKAAGFVVSGNQNLLLQYAYRTPATGTGVYVTFPTPFAGQPTVIATAESLGGQWVNINSISPTGFSVTYPNTGGNLAINWIAIGPTN